MDIQKQINEKESRILTLKTELRSSDYKVIRMDNEGYPIEQELLDLRENKRKEIRTILDEIVALKVEQEKLSEIEFQKEKNYDI